jgi:hypothetical protein
LALSSDILAAGIAIEKVIASVVILWEIDTFGSCLARLAAMARRRRNELFACILNCVRHGNEIHREARTDQAPEGYQLWAY